jgi:uncharacterized protein
MKLSWYREPLVWLLILFPASAVFGGIITIVLAVNSNDGLVVDDYYKRGLEINQTLERDKAAIRYGLQATLRFHIEHQWIELNLHARSDYQLPSQIWLQMNHHTRSGFDQKVLLKRTGDLMYQGKLPSLEKGTFFVQLMADDWRLLKSVRMPITELQMGMKN